DEDEAQRSHHPKRNSRAHGAPPFVRLSTYVGLEDQSGIRESAVTLGSGGGGHNCPVVQRTFRPRPAPRPATRGSGRGQGHSGETTPDRRVGKSARGSGSRCTIRPAHRPPQGGFMRRKTKNELRISAEHAAIALKLLIQDGKVAAADVTRALKNREQLIRDLRSRLAMLETAARPAALRLAGEGRRVVRAARPQVRRALSQAQRTARKAQGQYLASIRRLSRDARAKIREVRKKSGVAAAIKAARRMAS